MAGGTAKPKKAGRQKAEGNGLDSLSIEAQVGAVSDSLISPQTYLANYHRHYDANSVDDIQFRLTRAIVVAGREWRKLCNDKLRDIGQTQARWETLFLVSFSGNDAPQSELARLIGIEGPTLVRMLDVLEQDGLIRRRQSEADRRVTLNSLTEKGEAAIEEIKQITNALRREVLDDLPSEELAIAQRVLSRIIGKLVDLR